MSDEIVLKDARTQNIRQGPRHHKITLMDPTKKKERQRKKNQNIKNKIKKKKSTKSIFDEYEIFGVLRHYHVVSMPFEQF